VGEILRWYRRQIRTNDGLAFIVPAICFLMGIMTTYSGEFMSGWAVTFLMAFFSFFASAMIGDIQDGVILIGLAVLGEILAICLMVWPFVFVSVAAVVVITVLTNKDYREWQAKRRAVKGLTR